jgi:hypothetical protein
MTICTMTHIIITFYKMTKCIMALFIKTISTMKQDNVPQKNKNRPLGTHHNNTKQNDAQ